MMSDPFDVLGLGRDADQATVRQRYLELVRQFPPEREPQRFAEIRQAYDQLREPTGYLANYLFPLVAPQSFDSLLAQQHVDIRARRLPTDVLLSLGRS